MRKILTFLLMFLTISSVACAEEITFRGIPWGLNISDTLSKLDLYDTEKIEENSNIDVHKIVCVYESHLEEFGSQRLIEYSSFENCGYKCTPRVSTDIVVAGYDVKWLELQFLYGIEDGEVSCDQRNAELYSGKYEFRPDDYVAAYEDLLNKMIWLYGEPVVNETVNNDSYLTKHRHERYARWNGDNDTAVLLYVKYYTDDTNIYRYELSIEYAKTDVLDKVDFIERYFEQEARNEKYNAENTDGL